MNLPIAAEKQQSQEQSRVAAARTVPAPAECLPICLELYRPDTPVSLLYSERRQEAIEREAAALLKAGVGKDVASAAPVRGIGLARAASLGGQELQDLADDERYLRKVSRGLRPLSRRQRDSAASSSNDRKISGRPFDGDAPREVPSFAPSYPDPVRT